MTTVSSLTISKLLVNLISKFKAKGLKVVKEAREANANKRFLK